MMGKDPQDPLHADISKQYFSTYHWHPTPDGFSGFFAPGRQEIGYEMESFPSARAISLMQALDVRYLVVHFDQLPPSSHIQRSDLDQVAGLKSLQDFDSATVYRVAPSFYNAAQLNKQLYLPKPAQAGAPYVAYLILSNSIGWPFAVKPTDKLDLTARWSDGRAENIVEPLPLVTSTASVIPIHLQAPVQPGKFSLRLEARNGALGNFDLGGEVEVGPEPAREVVIPARAEMIEPVDAQLYETYPRGATVFVQVMWEPFGRIDAYYSVSVRLVDAQGKKVLNVDREPRVRTFDWRPDEFTADPFELHLPEDLTPGKYRIELLMYQAETDTSVLLLDQNLNPQERMTLGQFQVR